MSDMFYTAELECEMRQSPQRRLQWSFTKDEDREKYLEMVVSEMREQRYNHTPAEGCTERG